MTSGPMRAGALPPDRQPDPQVVAWMRAYRRQNPDHGRGKGLREFVVAHSPDGYVRDIGIPLSELGRAWEAAKPPLTVADVPAGQGPASLFIASDADGSMGAWFKNAEGWREVVMYEPVIRTPGRDAVWEHLAATLPHAIDTAEESK